MSGVLSLDYLSHSGGLACLFSEGSVYSKGYYEGREINMEEVDSQIEREREREIEKL